jgi:UDP-N-acetylmuramate--alanine ligase
MLAELMRLKFGIAVAGSHGKTTTTSMTASVLAAANLDPTMVVGGRLNSLGTNARLGKGDFMVVESDESDRSFLHLAPILAVITSIDREHLDCYGSLEELCRAYTEFANKVPFYGASIVCLDNENVQAIVPSLRRRVISYGMQPGADLIADEVVCGHFQSRFRLRHKERDLGLFELRVPGRHNVWNATAAVAVGLELKIDLETIRAALAEFGGVERRFEARGVVDGVTVVDDYGHHPTEIRATLAAARDCGFGRVLAVFQPHRYTRTALLLDDFGPSFADADQVFVLDIYAAGETPIEGISAQALVERMRAVTGREFTHQPSGEDLLQELREIVQPGDVVLTLGAGNVWQLGDRLLELLRERSAKIQEVSSRA